MVNLADVRGRRSFAHIQSGIGSLDEMVALTTNGIVDFQTVPGTSAAEAIVAVYIQKHLEHSKTSHVVVIDCLRAFPMKLVSDHTQYEVDQWVDRIHWYHDVGFARLEWLFGELSSSNARSDVLIVVNSFHEACNLYRNLLVLRTKETLLQFQIDRNDTLIRGLDRFKEEGVIPKLAQLPQGSELLKVSPASKFDTHLIHLLSCISLVAYSKNLLVILNGTMDVGWRTIDTAEPLMLPNVSSSSTQPPSSQLFLRSDRLQLAGLSPSARLSFVSSFLKTPAVNAYISKRVLFYKDWYHRTVHFSKRFEVGPTSQLQLDPHQLRAVYGAAVFVQNISGSKQIGSANFDFKNSFYRKFDTNISDYSKWTFLDLNSYKPLEEPSWLSDSEDDEQEYRQDNQSAAFTLLNIPPSSPSNTGADLTIDTTVENTNISMNILPAAAEVADDSQLIGDSEEEGLL